MTDAEVTRASNIVNAQLKKAGEIKPAAMGGKIKQPTENIEAEPALQQVRAAASAPTQETAPVQATPKTNTVKAPTESKGIAMGSFK